MSSILHQKVATTSPIPDKPCMLCAQEIEQKLGKEAREQYRQDIQAYHITLHGLTSMTYTNISDGICKRHADQMLAKYYVNTEKSDLTNGLCSLEKTQEV